MNLAFFTSSFPLLMPSAAIGISSLSDSRREADGFDLRTTSGAPRDVPGQAIAGVRRRPLLARIRPLMHGLPIDARCRWTEIHPRDETHDQQEQDLRIGRMAIRIETIFPQVSRRRGTPIQIMARFW
jgi:hypothetical protein